MAPSERSGHSALVSEEVYDDVEPPRRACTCQEVPALVGVTTATMDRRLLESVHDRLEVDGKLAVLLDDVCPSFLGQLDGTAKMIDCRPHLGILVVVANSGNPLLETCP